MSQSKKDDGLYGIHRERKLGGSKEINSSTSLAFSSQLSSLITASNKPAERNSRNVSKTKKDDIFALHNRNTAKRAKKDLIHSDAYQTSHRNDDKTRPLDPSTWAQSQRKMEEKSRLYAAMKRGDVEDHDERYAVDFDRKWAERNADGKEDDDEEQDESSVDSDVESRRIVEYIDEFGRARTGTAAEAARMERIKNGKRDLQGDRFTARPIAPSSVIYGDAIQHAAFDPDELRAAQMEELAKKRDRSMTPPPAEHFDASREIRTKGTGFFQFSGDVQEREKQMENLAQERATTEAKRQERLDRLEERKKEIEARRAALNERREKRKADDFLEQLGEEIHEASASNTSDMSKKIEAAIANETDD